MFFPTPRPDGQQPFYNPEAPIQPVQIIAFGLILGCVVFAAIATVMVLQDNVPKDDPVLPTMAAVAAAMATVARFIVPSIIAGSQLENLRSRVDRNDTEATTAAIYAAFQTAPFSRAPFEGAAFFALVAFLVSKQWWVLGIAGGLVFLMAATFPTKGRIEHFINDHQQQLEFEDER